MVKRLYFNAFSQSIPLVTRIGRLPLLACTSCCDSQEAASIQSRTGQTDGN